LAWAALVGYEPNAMSSIAEGLVELGQRAYDRGDLAEAEDLFRRAHTTGRNHVEVLHFPGFPARAMT
jgi:hypothetical protein